MFAGLNQTKLNLELVKFFNSIRIFEITFIYFSHFEGISPKGIKYILKMTDSSDLNRDILKVSVAQLVHRS